MYAAHLLVCAWYLWRKLGFVPARGAVAAWGFGLCAVAVVSALNWNQIHATHALSEALRRWDEAGWREVDDATDPATRSEYLAAFVATIKASRPS